VSSLDQFTEAFAQLKRAWADDRLAHAYLICGSPSGAGLALVHSLIKLLYCEAAEPPCGVCPACQRAVARQLPDVTWVEPENKSRIISVDQIRSLIDTVAQTAFGGGWKVGVVLACDRMKVEGANAFLKTLEEPPGKTLLLLVTDQMQGLLPTIVSRCQKVVLAEPDPEPVWMEKLVEILSRHNDESGLQALLLAGRLKALLDEIKAGLLEKETAGQSETEVETGDDEDTEAAREIVAARVQAKLVKERTDVLRAVQFWQRDLLACRVGGGAVTLHFKAHEEQLRRLAGRLPVDRLLERTRAADRMVRLTGVNVADLVALESELLAASVPEGAR
jgi:DNA polymerase-3 subunit delta'